jgi:prophage antirepressor-like protein
MSTNLQVFNFNGNDVRTVIVNEEPWWVLRDVCDVLGLSNSRIVADRLDEDDVSQTYITDSLGRRPQTSIVNESGLYTVIIRSDKPDAAAFRKWITKEVLPSIRKTGAYSRVQTMTRGELLLEMAKQALEIEAIAPKADYYDAIFGASAVNTGDIARFYGVTAPKINKWLEDAGFQSPTANGRWKLMAGYTDKGLAKVRNGGHMQFTPKGQHVIHEVLAASGHTPTLSLASDQQKLLEQ